MDRSLLVEILRETLGSGVHVAGIHVIKSLRDYQVVSATLERPRLKLIVKLAGPQAPLACPFDRTAALLRLVREQTGVPVAEVLAADVSYARWPVRFMVRTFAPGQEWAAVRSHLSGGELRDAHAQIGQAVAELHRVRFLAFGELSPDMASIGDGPFANALIARAERRIADHEHARLFLEVVKSRSELFQDVTQPRLCHEDLHGHNILFNRQGARWRLSAVLDFDSAWAGHYESDIARLELWRGMAGDGFWEGYGTMQSVDERYAQRRPIYQLLWCLEYQSISNEHLADTQRVCAELGMESPLAARP
jgi:aminoglycoside phosphotransferase (APT) family kinase protein